MIFVIKLLTSPADNMLNSVISNNNLISNNIFGYAPINIKIYFSYIMHIIYHRFIFRQNLLYTISARNVKQTRGSFGFSAKIFRFPLTNGAICDTIKKYAELHAPIN